MRIAYTINIARFPGIHRRYEGDLRGNSSKQRED